MTGLLHRHRPRPLLAWLAIVALLIDTLAPTSFAASLRRASQGAGVAMCGHAGSAPAKPAPLDPLQRCPCCCPGAVFVAPPAGPGLAPPRRVALVSHASAARHAPPSRFLRQSAQPRAPPSGA